jgi:hypothetical protein
MIILGTRRRVTPHVRVDLSTGTVPPIFVLRVPLLCAPYDRPGTPVRVRYTYVGSEQKCGARAVIQTRLPSQQGKLNAQLRAEADGRVIQRQTANGHIQIELVPFRPALETLKHIPLNVDRKDSAPGPCRLVDGTRSSELPAQPSRWRPANDIEDLLDPDSPANFLEIDRPAPMRFSREAILLERVFLSVETLHGPRYHTAGRQCKPVFCGGRV